MVNEEDCGVKPNHALEKYMYMRWMPWFFFSLRDVHRYIQYM